MGAPQDNTIPPRSGIRRLIRPWEYRHRHAIAGVRFAAGGFNLGVGLVLVSLGRKAGTDQDRRKCYRFAAWFLASAPLQFLGGYLDMTADRSPRRRNS
jgi:hypothetical protein